MSEIAETTKTFASRKDSAQRAIARGESFHYFDEAIRIKDGSVTQSRKFDTGVIRGVAVPTRGTSDLFHATFDVTFPPVGNPQEVIPGSNLVLFATLPRGETYAAEGSKPTVEGGHQVEFRLWRPVDRKMLDVVKRNKGLVLKEIRKRQAQPLPALDLNELAKVTWSIT